MDTLTPTQPTINIAKLTENKTDNLNVTTNQDSDEVCCFDADIQRLMGLIVNSFYSNNDIFLRELISNASDALDKIKYNSLTNTNVLGKETNLEIRLTLNKENNTLTIEDTGIGMTNADLKNNLGTIASSGTQKFVQAVKEGTDLSMIGQFGVGFYSAFLVADKLEVLTKNNDDDEYLWSSTGGSEFTIRRNNTPSLHRGTRIVLHIKTNQQEYLEESKLRQIIKTHSEFITYPIKLLVTKTREVDDEYEEETDNDDDNNNDIENTNGEESSRPSIAEVDEDDSIQKTKTAETYTEWDTLNSQKPLWTRKSDNITAEEYQTFYKNMTNDWDEAAGYKHFSAEGNISLKGLIYIPKRPPFDMFSKQNKKSKVKLYVRRVFITDDCNELMPDYLTFVSGVVDSEDLPLNVSREILQQNKMLKVIRKILIKKSLELVEDLKEDEEEYQNFYNNFSKSLKLGVYENSKYRERLTKLLMFNTSKTTNNMRTLDQYVDDMAEEQPGIYYITGESKEIVGNSPFVERLNKKGWEVLYFVDPIDEYMLQQLKEFRNKQLICITKGDLDLGETDEEKSLLEQQQKEYEGLCNKMKDILGDQVEGVKISNRVTNSPCCLVSSQFGWTANMERIMKAQAITNNNNNMRLMMSKKTMELNPDSNIVKNLKRQFVNNSESLSDMVWMLYETSVLDSGFSLEQPRNFTERIYRLLQLGLNVEDDDNSENESEKELDEIPNVNDLPNNCVDVDDDCVENIDVNVDIDANIVGLSNVKGVSELSNYDESNVIENSLEDVD